MPTTQLTNDDGRSGLHHGLILKIVDAGLLAILTVAPLFMGGRHPAGELVFVSLVALVTSAWLIGQRQSSSEWMVSSVMSSRRPGAVLQSLPVTPAR